MRIISQNGLSDYPYDNIFVWINRKNQREIGTSMCSDPNSEFELGTYDSEEDALLVMKLIRRAANDGYTYFFMPSVKEIGGYK